jgi:hypothetical protein
MKNKNRLSTAELNSLLELLRQRFEKHAWNKGVSWNNVEARLKALPDQCWSLSAMEQTGGEPALIRHEKKSDAYVFMDCSAESPKDRRSWCYDRDALDKRKENKPSNDAMSAMKNMGVEILSEEDYRYLQTLGKFDLKTSSWILTPSAIRKLGGALFCDRRYDTVFTYHNGADSYYAARGVRGKVRV